MFKQILSRTKWFQVVSTRFQPDSGWGGRWEMWKGPTDTRNMAPLGHSSGFLAERHGGKREEEPIKIRNTPIEMCLWFLNGEEPWKDNGRQQNQKHVYKSMLHMDMFLMSR